MQTRLINKNKQDLSIILGFKQIICVENYGFMSEALKICEK